MAKLECVINGLLHELDGCMFRDMICGSKICNDCSYKNINGCLDKVLTDAIELLTKPPQIVRCMNCKHYINVRTEDHGVITFCNSLYRTTTPDWFCAYGERDSD